jgi:hypothetical protein
MNGTNDTNMTVSGSGTASDPRTFDFHTTGNTYVVPGVFYIIFLTIIASVAIAGFMLGFYFGKRRKN